MHRAHPLHRRFQIIKSARRDHRCDLRGHAVALVPFVEHNHARRLLSRIDQRLLIQRPERARIDHFGADIELFQQFRRAQRHVHHAAGGDQRDIAAFALHVSHAERNGVLLRRYRAFELEHHLVFEEDHRVFVADSRLEQPLGVIRRRGQHHFQTRYVTEPGVQRLRMLRGRPARGAQRGPHHHGDLPLAARHVVNFGRLVHHLVHGQPDKIAEHDIDHRPHACHRRAHRQPGKSGFRDGRIDHPFGPELFHQAGEYLEGRARFGHVFAHHEDAIVAAHLFRQRFADRFSQRQFPGCYRSLRHTRPDPLCRQPDREPPAQIERPAPSRL